MVGVVTVPLDDGDRIGMGLDFQDESIAYNNSHLNSERIHFNSVIT